MKYSTKIALHTTNFFSLIPVLSSQVTSAHSARPLLCQGALFPVLPSLRVLPLQHLSSAGEVQGVRGLSGLAFTWDYRCVHEGP